MHLEVGNGENTRPIARRVVTREADSGGRVAGVAGDGGTGAPERRVDRPAVTARRLRARLRGEGSAKLAV